MTHYLRPPRNPEEKRLAQSIAHLIADRRDRGASFFDALFAVDQQWPDVPFRLVLAALLLEDFRREQVAALQ